MTRSKLAHLPIAALGVVTICVYGAWYYSFGVLLDPIIIDTGWNEALLAGSFSLGILLVGVGSLFGGRLLDRVGTRCVFGVAALLGGSGLLVASLAQDLVVFAVGSAIGLGALGALGFYHVTMTAVVRLHPDDSGRAIAALTIWGALASPVFLPLSAWMVEEWGWRVTTRALAALAVTSLVGGILLVPLPDRQEGEVVSATPRIVDVARAAIDTREARAFTAAVALIGISISVILAYQVPVMTAAGLPLATAATMAGVRGFSQLGGRIPLGALVSRIGARRALLAALSAIAVGTLILAGAGTVPVALLFAVVAGFGIGAYSPLQGMYSAELFDHRALGATMGMYTSISMLAGSMGPVMAGVVAEATGDRRWAAVLASVTAVASLIAMATARTSAHRSGRLPVGS